MTHHKFWEALVEAAHSIAVDKGWHDDKEPTIDRAMALVALTHTEVTEFSEELRDFEWWYKVVTDWSPRSREVWDSVNAALGVEKQEFLVPELYSAGMVRDVGEALAGTKLTGPLPEIADIVIRLADMWGACKFDLPETDPLHFNYVEERQSFLDEGSKHHAACDYLTHNIHRSLTRITEALRVGRPAPALFADVMRACVVAASTQSLWVVVLAKMAYNTTRPRKHGKLA